MDPMCIILIVKIWNVLDVNRLGPVGDYICVCPTRVASTELETVDNDSRSIPEEEEEPLPIAVTRNTIVVALLPGTGNTSTNTLASSQRSNLLSQRIPGRA
jgi:hypothetical protein